MELRPITSLDAPAVAALHIEGIGTGFISSLGEKFVEYLYERIVTSTQAFGFVAAEDGKVIGFISCTESVAAIYKYILKKHFFRLVLAILPKMLRLYYVKSVIETLFYPIRCGANLPSVEILAIVVDEQRRTMGIGRRLIKEALHESRRRGIEKIKVMVGEPLPANKFYRHLGFQLVGQYRHHGHLANAYVMDVGGDTGS